MNELTQQLLTLAALQIPVALFAVAMFKHWSKATTLKVTKRVLAKHKGAHVGGIAVRKFGVTLFEMPVCAATLRLARIKAH
jgi:hypothetical protein